MYQFFFGKADTSYPGQISTAGNLKRSTPSAYRPEIDGLRALAILVVVGFHAFPTMVPSGFVGVDVFFVISGYLISTIILNELDRDNFSFINFYLRRIRRIFPALILVLIAVYAVGWLSLFAEEFRILGEHIFAGAAFVINLLLMRQLGYFDTAAHAKPLLHLWSLAVEEQFYLIWPILLWSAARARLSTSWPILVLCLVSFAINIILLKHRSMFFSPVSRFWELMLGSFLAFLALNEPEGMARLRSGSVVLARRLNIGAVDLAACAGVVFIAIAVRYASVSAFPGWWALLPTVGTCLLIFAGSEAWLNRAVFSNKGLVAIGLISYPLYLWHWPILSFIWILRGNAGSVSIRMVAVASAFVLAALTYLLVEKPIRFGPHRTFKSVALAAMLFCVGCAGAATYALQGLPSRFAAAANLPAETDLSVPTSSRSSDSSCPRQFNIALDPDEVCLVNAAEPKFLFFGDSTAMALNSAAYDRSFDLKTALVATHAHIWGTDECLADRNFTEWLQRKMQCSDIANHALLVAEREPSIDTVVISFALEDQFTYQHDKLLALQNAFLQLHKRVIYLIVPPLFHLAPASCVTRVAAFGSFTETSKECVQDRARMEASQQRYRAAIDALKAADPGVLTYDAANALCDAKSCAIDDDRGPIYFIDGHVNARGSKRLLAGLMAWYDKLPANR